MAFQLNIRHNIDTAGKHFARGKVLSFDSDSVRVGADSDCECAMEGGEFGPVHFRIDAPIHGGEASLVRVEDYDVYVNDVVVSERSELLSGDEIRVGHWTFRFQKLFPETGHARHAGVLSVLAKALVVMILASELVLVVWLPRRMRHIAIWQNEIAKQRTVLLLDSLRSRNRKAVSRDELEKAARKTIGVELDARARYLRENDGSLSAGQRELMYRDLEAVADILDRFDRGEAVQSIPAVAVDSGIDEILKRADREK